MPAAGPNAHSLRPDPVCFAVYGKEEVFYRTPNRFTLFQIHLPAFFLSNRRVKVFLSPSSSAAARCCCPAARRGGKAAFPVSSSAPSMPQPATESSARALKLGLLALFLVTALVWFFSRS